MKSYLDFQVSIIMMIITGKTVTELQLASPGTVTVTGHGHVGPSPAQSPSKSPESEARDSVVGVQVMRDRRDRRPGPLSLSHGGSAGHRRAAAA
jgi:hypothetical protein